MKLSSLTLKHFSIPSHNAHVDFVSFLASLRTYSRGTSIVSSVSPSYYAGYLKRIYINQFTADRILQAVSDSRGWSSNQHGVVVSFLHYKFWLNNELKDFEFGLDYDIRALVGQNEGEFPGIFHSEGNHQRGASMIDRGF